MVLFYFGLDTNPRFGHGELCKADASRFWLYTVGIQTWILEEYHNSLRKLTQLLSGLVYYVVWVHLVGRMSEHSKAIFLHGYAISEAQLRDTRPSISLAYRFLKVIDIVGYPMERLKNFIFVPRLYHLKIAVMNHPNHRDLPAGMCCNSSGGLTRIFQALPPLPSTSSLQKLSSRSVVRLFGTIISIKLESTIFLKLSS